jgi:hypothetical protein
MQTQIRLIMKYMPLWTIAAIVICICYVSGFFHYPGLEFMTVLEFGDYVSLSMPAIPIILFALLALLAMSDDPLQKEMEQRQALVEADQKEMAKPTEQRRWNRRPGKKYEKIATLATPVVASLYLSLSHYLPPPLSFVSFLYLFGATAVLGTTFLLFAINRNIDLGMAAIIAFFFCGAAYSSGMFASSLNYFTSRDVVMELDDGRTRCVNVIALTRHGPIFTDDYRTTQIANWSHVRLLAERPRCAVSEEQQQPDA